MAEPAHPDDRHPRAGAGVPMPQRREGRDPRAEQRRGDVQADRVGNRDHEPVLDDDRLAVAAVGRLAVVVVAVVGQDHPLRAVLLLARRAVLALAARIDEAADPDPIPDRMPFDRRADRGHGAGDLVARDHRERRPAPLAAGLVDVAVADAGEGDLDRDVVGPQVAAVDRRPLEGGAGARRLDCSGLGHLVSWLVRRAAADYRGCPARRQLAAPGPGAARSIIWVAAGPDRGCPRSGRERGRRGRRRRASR